MESIDKKAKAIKACETCKKTFSITRIRHTCKRCNKIICYECTKARMKIITYDLKAEHKVCIACEKESKFQADFRAKYHTSWNTLSKIGQTWLEACRPKETIIQAQGGHEESYADYLKSLKNPQPSPTKEHIETIDRDIAQGRLDRERTNYSFQEFLYYSQEKLKTNQIRAAMANVLKAFVVKFPSIGYCQGLNYICMFLLGLMDEEATFWTLCYIVTNLLPVNFYGQTSFGVSLVGYQQEKFVLGNLIKDHIGADPAMTNKINLLLDINGPILLSPLLINYTNFEVLFESWNKMLLNKTINEIRKIIIYIAQIFLPKVTDKNVTNPVEFQLMTIRLFNTEDFKDAQSIQIKDDHVKFLISKFKGDYSSQLAVTETKMHLLPKNTQFNKGQLKKFREHFQAFLSARPRRSSMKGGSEEDGIGKEDFRKLLTEVLSKEAESKNLLQGLDFDQLYNSFDSDKNGTLDFKEFLFLVSMMLKGSFEEKIQSAFHVFDNGDKGHLTMQEFEQFLQIFIQTTVQANQDNITPFFNQDLEKFNETMETVTHKKDKIPFSLVKKDMLGSNFIKYCSAVENIGHSDGSKAQKNDGSALFTDQTKLDSTQDLSQGGVKHEDLTKVLDTENSTVLEHEESHVIDEAHIEKILHEEHKIGEEINEESVVYVAEEPEDRSFADANKDGHQKSLKIDISKQQEDSDNEEEMLKLMQKWKGSPTKTAKTPANISQAVEIYDNPLTPLPQQETDLNPNDGIDYFLTLFGGTLDLPSFPQETVLTQRKVGKPFASEGCESLPQDIPPKPRFGGWEENCFVSTQNYLTAPQHVQTSMKIPKPILNNNIVQPLPPQDECEKPSLAFSLLDLSTRGDKPILSIEANFFGKTDQPQTTKLLASRSVEVKKPFETKNGAIPMPRDLFDEHMVHLSWKDNCFETLEKTVASSEIVRLDYPIKKPFMQESYHPVERQEEIIDRPTLQGWNENCFKAKDKQPAKIDEAYPNKKAKNPFSAGICDGLPLHRRLSGDNALEAWKDGPFNLHDNAFKSESSQSDKLIKNPFWDGQYIMVEDHGQNEAPRLNQKRDIFRQMDKAVAPSGKVKASRPVMKPIQSGKELEPMEYSENFENSVPELKLFGSENKACLPSEKASFALRAVKVNKPLFDNAAKCLRPDESDSKPIFIFDFMGDGSDSSRVNHQHHQHHKVYSKAVPHVPEKYPGPVPKIQRVVVEEKKTEEGTNSDKKIVYTAEENEEDMNKSFLNQSAVNTASQKPALGIYTEIGESTKDIKLEEKRKLDATKNAVAEQKSDSCKVCNVF